MQFHVAQLIKEHTGSVRRFEINEEARQLGADDMTIEAPISGEVTLLKDTDGILVTGHLETEVGVPCVRCLEPVTVSVEIDLEEQYYPTVDVETGRHMATPDDIDADTRIDQYHVLDISELVRQSLVLAIPMQAKHAFECAPTYAVIADDEEEITATDPRWAALAALRDRDSEP